MAEETNGVAMNVEDHFQTIEDSCNRSRKRNSHASPSPTGHASPNGRASPSGRASPTQSAHLGRTSIVKITDSKKAKKVRFYRNGDRFFKGMIYAVSPERFRTFESLLVELTGSPLCDKDILPNGVRSIFTLDGSKKLTNLDQLENDESYVCASGNMFKKLDYTRSHHRNWSPNVNVKANDVEGYMPLPDKGPGEQKDNIKPKLVTVIRNGSKPRKAVRILLNKKTARSYDQVLTDVTEAIKLDSGAVRRIYTLSGKLVANLNDFFGEESIFVAYGCEKHVVDDFDLDDNELKFVGAYRLGKPKDRVTLGSRSPRPVRRALSSSTRSLNEGTKLKPFVVPKSPGPSRNKMFPTSIDLTRSAPNSPMFRRKPKLSTPNPKSPVRSKANGFSHMNGNTKSPIHSATPPSNLTEKYQIGQLIGEGNFAVVKSCIEKKMNKKFALKMIDKTRCKGKEHMIENEVNILRRMQHPNIVTLVEDFETNTELYLVMEFLKGGDLFDAISTSTKYTERDAVNMLHNLASALKYLHSLNIVHRDIKPENLLICEYEDGTKSLKLGDFGLATVVDGPLRIVCGTPTYVAPEILEEEGYGLKVDIWAVGVITYILLCGFPPFVSATNNNDELFDKIMSGHYEFTSPFWDDISDSAKDLISHMLDVNAQARYSAEQVLAHPWVADDTAKDNDLHVTITKEIGLHFNRKKKGDPSVNVIAITALDKVSRYFQPPKHSQAVHNGDHEVDEVF